MAMVNRPKIGKCRADTGGKLLQELNDLLQLPAHSSTATARCQDSNIEPENKTINTMKVTQSGRPGRPTSLRGPCIITGSGKHPHLGKRLVLHWVELRRVIEIIGARRCERRHCAAEGRSTLGRSASCLVPPLLVRGVEPAEDVWTLVTDTKRGAG